MSKSASSAPRRDTLTLTGQDRRSLALDLLIAALLFGLAAYLRLDRLWLVQFKYDEAILADQALRLVEGRYLPLNGNPSGAGILNPPGFIYLIALPLLVRQSPLAVSAFLATLGTLAVPALYYLGRITFGRSTALTAGLLYAVNPWGAWFTRQIWEPDAVQLFAVAFAITLFRFVATGRGRWLALSVITFAVMTQIHFQTIVFAPVWLLGVLLARRRVDWRALAIGCLISLALYIPYLYGDYLRGWQSLGLLLHQPTNQAKVDFEAFLSIRQLVTDFSYFLPDDLAGTGRLAAVRWLALRQGEGWLVLAGIAVVVVTLVTTWRKSPQRANALAILLAWITFPLAMSTRHWLALYVHYFVTVLPALCLAAGFAVGQLLALPARLVGRGQQVARVLCLTLALVAVGSVTGAQISATRSLSDDLARGNRDRYLVGVPISATLELSASLRQLDISRLTVIAPGTDLRRSLQVLSRDRITAEYYDSRLALPLPTNDGTYYVAQDDGGPAATLLAQAAANSRILRIEAAGRPAYSVYRLDAADASSLHGTYFVPSDLRFANGVTLRGTEIPRKLSPNQTVDVATYWKTDGQPDAQILDGTDVIISFAHLLDARGVQIATAQVFGHQPSNARQASQWITWVALKVPEEIGVEAGTVTFGLFREPGLRSITVTNAAGESLGTEARSGIVKLAGRPAPTTPPTTLLRASFADGIDLLGYDLRRAGGRLTVKLHWRASASPRADYQAFAQLLDSTNRLVAQQDQAPGSLPTSLWDVGDESIDSHVIELPASLPTGSYSLVVGLYTLADGRRLPLTTGAGSPADSVALESLVLP